MAEFFGATLYNLPEVVHGQPRSLKIIRDHYLFKGIPEGCRVGLYHSWAVRESSLTGPLEVTARSEDGVIMGLTHRNMDICGLQFHPESVITDHGRRMLWNWVSY
jgi:anthranilate/para-aminobenzoate synthase component II